MKAKKEYGPLTEEQKALVEANLGLAGQMARRLIELPHVRHSTNNDIQEVYQLAVLGLMLASQRYEQDHDSRANFGTYAWWSMWHYVQQQLVARYMKIHIPLHLIDALRREKEGIPSDWSPECIEAAKAARRIGNLKQTFDPDDGRMMHRPSLRQREPEPSQADEEQIRALLNRLPWKQRRIMVRRFGFDGLGERNITQVAEELGTSRQNAYQLYRFAKRNLKLLLSGQELPVPGRKKFIGPPKPPCRCCGRREGHHPKCNYRSRKRFRQKMLANS